MQKDKRLLYSLIEAPRFQCSDVDMYPVVTVETNRVKQDHFQRGLDMGAIERGIAGHK